MMAMTTSNSIRVNPPERVAHQTREEKQEQ
jgi:hypothetical protein